MAFFSLSALRTILATETDADSPGSEELLSQLRENAEALMMLAFDTGDSGTITAIAEESLDVSGTPWVQDEHIDRTLLITSGDAIGNMYTIDDNDTNTLVCTGDTLVTDGVAVDDTFKIFYDLLTNTDGHDHNGKNSKNLDVPMLCLCYGEEENFGPTSGAESEVVYEHYFYKQAYHETMYWQCQMYSTGSHTVQINIYFGSSSDSDSTASGSYTTLNGSFDISGEASGWNLVYVQIATTETDTVNMKRFASYVD